METGTDSVSMAEQRSVAKSNMYENVSRAHDDAVLRFLFRLIEVLFFLFFFLLTICTFCLNIDSDRVSASVVEQCTNVRSTALRYMCNWMNILKLQCLNGKYGEHMCLVVLNARLTSVSANFVEKCQIKIHDIGHSSRILHCLAVVENAMNLCNSSAHNQWQHFEVTHSPNQITSKILDKTLCQWEQKRNRRRKTVREGIGTGATCARRSVYQMETYMLTKYWIAK